MTIKQLARALKHTRRRMAWVGDDPTRQAELRHQEAKLQTDLARLLDKAANNDEAVRASLDKLCTQIMQEN